MTMNKIDEIYDTIVKSLKSAKIMKLLMVIVI